MAVDRVPYLVGGGFEHSAEAMRSALYASTGGAEGITSTGDLLVLPLAVPGTSVRVLPGAATLLNRYGGGAGQSYALRVASETEVPITATGSTGGRSDLIIARIDDPTYQGIAFDPATHEAARIEVIKGVPASTRSLAGLNLTYPAIPLARVDVPASTGTITAGLITDLRVVAQPRRMRRIFTLQNSAATTITAGTDFKTYVGDFALEVPAWASRMLIAACLSGMWMDGRIDNPLYAFGGVRVNVSGQVTPYEHFQVSSIRYGTRFSASTSGELTVPSTHRGKPQMAGIQLAHWAGNAIGVDSNVRAILDIEWYE